jgi:SAM-dependent methyltransferase
MPAENRRLDFWRRMAAQFGGPVLVLLCGSGHLAVAIEAIGLSVTGVDADATLLAHARLGAERADIDVCWVHADPRELALPRRFGLVVLDAELIAAYPETADRLRLMAIVGRHLAPKGAFGFEATASADDVDDLVAGANLEVVAQYGDWDFAPARRANARRITLCRPRRGA